MKLVERAARFLFLNKTCFNGLYRVNKSGKFNVPFGKYKNPNYCDEENLKAVSKILKKTKIYNDSFESILNRAKKGDFVYFDPPYHPISKTANFTSYEKNGFGTTEQIKLSEIFHTLDKRGCYLLLSNSDSDFIKQLYHKYDISKVAAARLINCNSKKRGKISEILVKNY